MCIVTKISNLANLITPIQFSVAGQDGQAGTLSLHNYVEACLLQYGAIQPCDPIKKKQVEASIHSHPWGLVENNCRAKKDSAFPFCVSVRSHRGSG